MRALSLSGSPLNVARAHAPDIALEALVTALEGPAGECLPADGRVLFLRARDSASLRRLDTHGWVFEQGFKPHADAFGRAGRAVVADAPDERYALVLVLPPRQRDEARALFARAASHLLPGGTLMASMPNAEGARTGEADMKHLVGMSGHLSKHKCRVFWSTPDLDSIDRGQWDAWRALDTVRPILDGRFVSRPGLFAWDRVDAASLLLGEALPATLRGRVADLGGGYGYLSARVLEHCPEVTALDLYEAEARALEPARQNMAAANTRGLPVQVHWHDVTTGLPHRHDAIVSNPPFHLGARADRPDLGRAFIAAAARALEPQGCLWLVANRHLAYEAALDAAFTHVRTVEESGGFKVIEAHGVRR